jgi:hypothetical protein
MRLELAEAADADGFLLVRGSHRSPFAPIHEHHAVTLGLSAAVVGYLGLLAGFAKLRQR